jgi:protein-S-isoprenylcysteine O-methyltransferase Ste14
VKNRNPKRSAHGAPLASYALHKVGRLAFFYFYVLFATALRWPNVGGQVFFRSDAVAWGGVLFCLTGLFLQQSFRIGIDIDRPDKLIVDGVFAFTRNPIYVGFGLILIGEFLILPNWVTLVYVVAAAGLAHRQVLREEEYLRGHYGAAYEQYCHRVRRYF